MYNTSMKTFLAILLLTVAIPAQAWTWIGEVNTTQVYIRLADPTYPSTNYKLTWVRYQHTTGFEQVALEQYSCQDIYKRVVVIDSYPGTRQWGQNIWIIISPATTDQKILNKVCRD